MEKLAFLKVTIFATDEDRGKFEKAGLSLNNPLTSTGSYNLLLPVSAISHLTESNPGNPLSNYTIHIKKDYPYNLPFRVKSANTITVSRDAIHLLK